MTNVLIIGYDGITGEPLDAGILRVSDQNEIVDIAERWLHARAPVEAGGWEVFALDGGRPAPRIATREV